MKLQIGRFTLLTQKASGSDLITHVVPSSQGWWPVFRESFAGAWQRNIQTPVEDALAHPTFWGVVTLIASDVAKCRPCLIEETPDGIETEVARQSPYRAVLTKPNHYQNRIQFVTSWMLSKLMRGNSYALKERDARGIVTALYLLDPTRVRPMVTPNGDVYYACQQDVLAGIDENSIVVPAREIIHDIAYAPYHPLCGFSPVYACGHMALQALTIANNTTMLFKNGAQIGGVLTAPGTINGETAARLEAHWAENYAGPENAGKIVALGDGLKFDAPKVMSAVDSQLIDQLNWDDAKICAVFHFPGYKVGVGPLPSYNNVEALGQEYYGDCLQIHFESLELCLTEGLELESVGYDVQFDIEALARMDSVQKMDAATKGVVGGVYAPNEARKKFNLKPVPGGDTVLLQRQNWPIQLLGSDQSAPMPPPVVAEPPVKAFEDLALYVKAGAIVRRLPVPTTPKQLGA